jgi:hypothetical protein
VVGTLVLALTLAFTLGGCGSGGARQDASEPSGKFPVKIVTSSFPTRQRLAQTSLLQIGVENSGQKVVPELAITISIDKNAIQPFSIFDKQPGLADPDRPVWVLENNYPKLAGEIKTAGAETANDKTFNFGPLKPGNTVNAVWKVTPVKAGVFTVDYQVDAGLEGKAKAVTSDGGPPTGSFVVKISDKPPNTIVNDNGDVVEVPQGANALSGSGGGNSGGKSGSGSGK